MSDIIELISSAFGTEEGKVFYRPTDWLGSCDPMTHYMIMTPNSSTDWMTDILAIS
jgi:hypothetical protein